MLSWWRVVPLLELVDSLEGGFLAGSWWIVWREVSLLSWWTVWRVVSLLSWWRVVPLLQELVDSLEGVGGQFGG